MSNWMKLKKRGEEKRYVSGMNPHFSALEVIFLRRYCHALISRLLAVEVDL